jgi:hypothetical protein
VTQGGEPKLLFVLSNDHGELFNAMYFVLGTGLRASFLLPPRLFALNAQGFPYPVAPYRSAEDVLAAVEAERPDLVMLFSGYLFVINRILDFGAQADLIAALRARGVRAATTDPSVGVLSRVGPETFDPRNPGRDWLTYLCPQIHDLLREVPHLYLAPEVDTDVRREAFFNPAISPDAEGRARIAASLREWQPIDASQPRWLFVLSPEDLEVQASLHGAERFAGTLMDRLADAAAAGRQPVLVGPRELVARLRASGRSFGGLVALGTCNFTLFMRLLYEAEHVFYWNTFSASIVARAVSRLPLFLFDRGHLVRAMPVFAEVATRHFYPGCTLPLLAPDAPLDPEQLVELAQRQVAELWDPVWANLSRGSHPEAVVARLLG